MVTAIALIPASDVESNRVLWGQTIIYTCYCLAIILVIAWFAVKLTRPAGSPNPIKPGLFYGFVGLLALIGVSLHIITYNTIPWVPDDLHPDESAITKTFSMSVADHKFVMPEQQFQVPCGQLVRFSVTSDDLTYGWGLFRPDNSMVMQMQVVPGHANNLVWTFKNDGVYTIRSTEYSGPAGYKMIVPDAVKVTGCGTTNPGGRG